MTRLTRREFMKLIGWGTLGVLVEACRPQVGPTLMPTPTSRLTPSPSPRPTATLDLWSFWASEMPKRQFFNEAIQAFNESHPGLIMKVTWYETDPLIQALRAELQAKTGKPDTYYADPGPLPGYGISPWVANGWAADLTPYITVANLKPIDAQSWTYDGKLYGFPIESGTIAIYVNLDHFEEAGISFPSTGRMTRDEFKEAVVKLRKIGKVPMGAGIQDWPYSGGLILTSQLVRNLGLEEMPKLYKGQLSWNDPRVRDALAYCGELVQLGLYPKEMPAQRYVDGFLQFSRGEAAMYADGPWFLSRAYNPPEEGGIPPEKLSRIRVMDFPIVDGGANNDIMLHITGGSFLVNAYSKHIPEVASFWEFLNNPEWAKKWIRIVRGQTGIKSTITREDDPILYQLQQMEDASRLLNPGTMEWALSGDLMDVWAKVVVGGFMTGQATMEDAINAWNKAAGLP